MPREKGWFSEESVLTALGRKNQLLSLAVRPDSEKPLLSLWGSREMQSESRN